MLLKSQLFKRLCVICVCVVVVDAPPPVQPGLSEDELGSSEEVHQWSDQQSKRVEHRHDHPRAAAGEHRQGEVNNETAPTT